MFLLIVVIHIFLKLYEFLKLDITFRHRHVLALTDPVFRIRLRKSGWLNRILSVHDDRIGHDANGQESVPVDGNAQLKQKKIIVLTIFLNIQ